MRAIPHDTPRCRVCGCSRMRTDEAVDRGPVLLAECGRCGHRWTAPLSRPAALPHWETGSETASTGSPPRGAASLRPEGARVA